MLAVNGGGKLIAALDAKTGNERRIPKQTVEGKVSCDDMKGGAVGEDRVARHFGERCSDFQPDGHHGARTSRLLVRRPREGDLIKPCRPGRAKHAVVQTDENDVGGGRQEEDFVIQPPVGGPVGKWNEIAVPFPLVVDPVFILIVIQDPDRRFFPGLVPAHDAVGFCLDLNRQSAPGEGNERSEDADGFRAVGVGQFHRPRPLVHVALAPRDRALVIDFVFAAFQRTRGKIVGVGSLLIALSPASEKATGQQHEGKDGEDWQGGLLHEVYFSWFR